MRIAIILNEAAGSLVGKPVTDSVESLREIFESRGATVSIQAVPPDRCLDAIDDALAGDAEVIIIGGGDGTVHAAVNRIQPTGRAMGVLPLGSLNLIARDLGTPLEMEEAARALVEGEIRNIDVASVNGEIYLNSSVLGFYPGVVRERERQRKRHRLLKWPGMVLAMVKTMTRLPLLDLRLDWGQGLRRIRTPVMVVSNNLYDGENGILISRTALDHGKLGVYVARHQSGLGLLRLMMRASLGRWRDDRDLQLVTATELTVSSKRHRLAMVNDGEVRQMGPPLNYRIMPGALKVLAPVRRDDADPASPPVTV